jgi:hypothetical protein
MKGVAKICFLQDSGVNRLLSPSVQSGHGSLAVMSYLVCITLILHDLYCMQFCLHFQTWWFWSNINKFISLIYVITYLYHVFSLFLLTTLPSLKRYKKTETWPHSIPKYVNKLKIKTWDSLHLRSVVWRDFWVPALKLSLILVCIKYKWWFSIFPWM